MSNIFENKGAMPVTVLVAASDCLNQGAANYVCDGVDDQVEIQAAIDAVSAVDGGKVILLDGGFNVSSFTIRPGVTVEGQGSGSESATPGYLGWKAGTVINVTGSITIQDGGARLRGVRIDCEADYVGDAVQIVGTDLIGLNLLVLDDVYFYCPTQTGTAFLLDATTTAGSNATIVANTFGHIYIQGFEYGLRIVADDTLGNTAAVTYNTFDNITTWGTSYSITWQITGTGDAGGNLFKNVMMEDPVGAHVTKGIQVDGAHNIFLNVDGADFLVSTIDIAASADRTYVRGLIPFYEDLGTNSVIIPVTLYPNVYHPAPLGLSELYGADIIIPFSEQGGVTANDISGSGKPATLVHAPPWGTQGQLYKITLDGANDYATIPNPALGGDRTYIIVVSPDFLETENVVRYMFSCYVDASNYVYLTKTDNADGNRIYIVWRSTAGGLKFCGKNIGFAQNDVLVLVVTYNDTDNTVRLYHAGVEIANVTAAGPIVGTSTMYLGSDWSPASFWKGWEGPFISLPRCMEAAEVKTVSEKLAKLTTLSQVYTRLQTPQSIALDLTGGATDIELFYARVPSLLRGYTILYNVATGGGAGVDIRVGRYQAGVVLDDDYFDISTSELNEAKGYSKHFAIGDLTQSKIAAGDTVTVGTAGGKADTGEVILILEIAELLD